MRACTTVKVRAHCCMPTPACPCDALPNALRQKHVPGSVPKCLPACTPESERRKVGAPTIHYQSCGHKGAKPQMRARMCAPTRCYAPELFWRAHETSLSVTLSTQISLTMPMHFLNIM